MDTNNHAEQGLATPTSKSAADPDTTATPSTLAEGGFTTPEPVPLDVESDADSSA